MTIQRFIIIYISFILFISCQENSQVNIESKKTSFEWQQVSISHEAINVDLDSLVFKIRGGTYGYIDEMFISKNDTVLHHDKYKLNYKEISKDKKGKMGCGSNMCEDTSDINLYNYYHPKFHPYYKENDLHTLQSVTKSVVSTIIGAAIQDKKIKGIDESVYPFLNDYKLSDTMKRHLQKTTIEDVLTMQLGLEWKEFGMSLEEESNVSAMELSNDWIDYVMKQPILSEPGIVWNYNSGASQLLSQVINKSTQQSIDKYANQMLFKKLNIKEYFWKKTPTGLPDTEGGLYLKTEDLAKIGLLHIRNGIWNDERILPVNWVKEAIEKQVKDIYKDGGEEGYGYQWWLIGDDVQPQAIGLGYGNQILVIIPETKVVGIIYAWNIFDNNSKYIFRDFLKVLMAI